MTQSSSMPGNPVPEKIETPDTAHLDPISGEPGSHPLGTALGGGSGAMLGAMAGTVVGGPVGTLVGSVLGAMAGGLAGSVAGEAINPTDEDAFWRVRHTLEPYYEDGRPYEDYAAAYRTGYEARAQHAGRSFEEIENDLRLSYDQSRGDSALNWDKARPATLAAWDRTARGTLV